MHLEIKRECNKIAVVENIDNIHNSTKLSFDGASCNKSNISKEHCSTT